MWKLRKCPICSSREFFIEFKIPPDTFLSNNFTLKIDVINQIGILSDPDKLVMGKCKQCGMFYIPYVLDENFLKQYYQTCIDDELSKSKIYKNIKKMHYLDISNNLLSYAYKYMGQDLNLRVFELGCGWGDFLQRIAGPGVDVIGSEFDLRKIEFCKTKNIRIVKSISDIKDEAKVNILFANQVFEHLDQPKIVMNELIPTLAKNFIGYFSVPYYSDDKMKERQKEVANRIFNDKNINPIEHLNYFTPTIFHQFLSRYNLQVFDIETLGIVQADKLKNTSFYFRFKDGY